MQILLFGIARDIVGDTVLRIADTEKISSVADVKNWISTRYPAFKQLSSFAVAVNRTYATDHDSLTGNEEIAIIPPVSGG